VTSRRYEGIRDVEGVGSVIGTVVVFPGSPDGGD